MTWPSTFPPGTLGYMQDRIGDEIARSDLTTEITQCITDSIVIYQRERFRFNETISTTFLTVGGQQNYNALTDINFPAVTGPQQIYFIDWLTITIPPAVFDMPRLQPEEILILTQTGTQMGQPYVYAFANETLMLYPVPPTGTPGTGPVSQLGSLVGGSGYPPGVFAAVPATGGSGAGLTLNVTVNGAGIVTSAVIANGGTNYVVGNQISAVIGVGNGFSAIVTAINATGQGPFLMTIGAHVTYAAPSSQSATGNRWMTDAEKLIRSRAKYELAINYTRDVKMATLMSPYAPSGEKPSGEAYEAYEMIKAEANRLAQRGSIRATPF